MDGRGLALDQNVIVVNMNYRLGTLGFLSGIDDEHRGNFGVRQGSTDQTGPTEQSVHNLTVCGSLVAETSKWPSNGCIVILNILVVIEIVSHFLAARQEVALLVRS